MRLTLCMNLCLVCTSFNMCIYMYCIFTHSPLFKVATSLTVVSSSTITVSPPRMPPETTFGSSVHVLIIFLSVVAVLGVILCILGCISAHYISKSKCYSTSRTADSTESSSQAQINLQHHKIVLQTVPTQPISIIQMDGSPRHVITS